MTYNTILLFWKIYPKIKWFIVHSVLKISYRRCKWFYDWASCFDMLTYLRIKKSLCSYLIFNSSCPICLRINIVYSNNCSYFKLTFSRWHNILHGRMFPYVLPCRAILRVMVHVYEIHFVCCIIILIDVKHVCVVSDVELTGASS